MAEYLDDSSDAMAAAHPADVLQNRLIDFAVEMISLVDSLPDTRAGRHVSGQVLRSGTSPAPNYAEARAAESTSDFIHKLKLVMKELNETHVWLRIIVRSKLATNEEMKQTLDECDQLSRIIAASIRTAEARRLGTNKK